MKLLYEIRRIMVPKLETAEGFEFNFEWRSQDYKQVMRVLGGEVWSGMVERRSVLSYY